MILIRTASGTSMPFSKGRLVGDVLAAGVDAQRAYQIASAIEHRLADGAFGNEVDTDVLVDLTAEITAEVVSEAIAVRYRVWRAAKRTQAPIVVALGGAPGVGKSTIASQLARQLGISRVVTTDTIREVLRTVIPMSVLPELHRSTYVTVDLDEDDAPLDGYRRQSRAVGSATIAVIQRLVHERRSVVVEGVHLVPGTLTAALAPAATDAIVVERLLYLEDELLHRKYLEDRATSEPLRSSSRPADHFDELRFIQAFLLRRAARHGVESVDIGSPFDLRSAVVNEVIAVATASSFDER